MISMNKIMVVKSILFFSLWYLSNGNAAVNQPIGLFPGQIPVRQWQQFEAFGFTQPVCGMIFDSENKTCCGMPLGGLGTGCLDIETTGVLGFCSLFRPEMAQFSYKFLCLRNPQMLRPFLGMSLSGKTWVLASKDALAGGLQRSCWDPAEPFGTTEGDKPYIDFWDVPVPALKNIRPAKSIKYWGHYPIADLDYETDAPVQVSLRAWSPFIPGDLAASSMPGAVFEVHLRNSSTEAQQGVLAFNFPGPEKHEVGILNFLRETTDTSEMKTLTVTANRCRYTLAVLGSETVRFGGDLSETSDGWSKIHQSLPQAISSDAGTSATVDFDLAPQEHKIIRFVLTWYITQWRAGSYRNIMGFDNWGENTYRLSRDNIDERDTYYPMYIVRFSGPLEVAKEIASQHEKLLLRIISWQQAVYTFEELPVWLRESLVNNLALFPEDSLWAAPTGKIADWAYPLGAFQMTESPRRCSIVGCTASNFYGDLPIAYFFPDLERMILKGYMANMRPDGAVPFLYPSKDFTKPTYDWQIGLNGACFVDLVHRLWLRTNDNTIVEQFYPAVKKNTTFTVNLAIGPHGIISFHREGHGQEWWELTPVYGMVTHLAGVRSAQLKMAQDMADYMRDEAFSQQCRAWLDEASNLTENFLWNEDIQSYAFYVQPEKNRRSDLIMSSQLDGEWITGLHGLGSVFRQDRIQKVLDTIENSCLTNIGVAGFAKSGAGDKLGDYGTFPPEIHIVAMTFMYNGRRELGLEIARRNVDNLVRVQGHPWDLPNLIKADSGKRTFGCDIYQNMVLWGLPAALAGQDLAGPSKSGGLVHRIIQAARR